MSLSLNISIPPTVRNILAAELTRLSGVTWRVIPGNPEHGRHEFTLVSSEHHEIMASSQWNDALRLTFRALEPERPDAITYDDVRGFDFPSISVAKDRFAESLAKDVNRRLLPKANEAWDRWHARVEEILGRRQTATDNLVRLIEVLPNAKVRSIGREHYLDWYDKGHDIRITVDVQESSGSVDVSLKHLPIELAEWLLRQTAGYIRPDSGITDS
jgi:hypothetical protein